MNKPHFVQISDVDEAAALQASGKFDNAKPHWVFRNGQVWAHVDEIFQTWRAARKAAANGP